MNAELLRRGVTPYRAGDHPRDEHLFRLRSIAILGGAQPGVRTTAETINRGVLADLELADLERDLAGDPP